MVNEANVPDGLYRLVKWQEDGNPVFPSKDTVVEVHAGYVVNLLTGRRCPLKAIGVERSLFGPLTDPYDNRRLRYLARFDLSKTPASCLPSGVLNVT